MPQWVIDLLKGALGWSAASFVYEVFVKPSRGRRRLAHVLAQEVGHNLELIVLQLEYFTIAPNELPADLKLADGVYKAVVGRIGELDDDVTGELILFYERVASINEQTSALVTLADAIAAIKRNPDAGGGIPALEMKVQQMNRAASVYKNTFATSAEQGDRLIRMLRVAETPLGKFGYRFRAKPQLDPAEARKRVAEHHDKMGKG
jgi:hypothetical protein